MSSPAKQQRSSESTGARASGESAEPAHSESSQRQTEHNAGHAGEREIGGRNGPDPTRYGDWEKGGRCIDF